MALKLNKKDNVMKNIRIIKKEFKSLTRIIGHQNAVA